MAHFGTVATAILARLTRSGRREMPSYAGNPMRYLAVALMLLAACASDRPSVEVWIDQQWEPIVQTVPEPTDATPGACEEALGELRERASGLDPSPSEELREAVHGWLNAAESLVFTCASEPDFDYFSNHERLLLRQDEVEALLAGS